MIRIASEVLLRDAFKTGTFQRQVDRIAKRLKSAEVRDLWLAFVEYYEEHESNTWGKGECHEDHEKLFRSSCVQAGSA